LPSFPIKAKPLKLVDTVELIVNGEKRRVATYPGARLLYILRNEFMCKGARFGCGTGHCGACTVLLDDRAVQSCDTPLEEAHGHAVMTAENLAHDAVGKLVRETFLHEQAAQCGYCINGIMMSATALLRQTLEPSPKELADLLHRHLCRCGAHQRILRSIKRAAMLLQTQERLSTKASS